MCDGHVIKLDDANVELGNRFREAAVRRFIEITHKIWEEAWAINLVERKLIPTKYKKGCNKRVKRGPGRGQQKKIGIYKRHPTSHWE